MNRALACLALAGLAALPRSLNAQDMPEALKASALAVRVRAVVPVASADQASPQLKSPGAQTTPAPQATPQADPALPGSKGSGSEAPSDKPVSWQSENIKNTLPGNPVLFKFVREDIAILVQLTPFDKPDGKGVTLVVQCQAWVKPIAGRLVYHASMDTLELAYDENFFFFPLGRDATTGKAPIRFDIAVSRTPGQSSAPSDKPNDKAVK